MKYHEAAEIAKQNPGSVLTRDALGSFIVRLGDGTVVGASGNPVGAIDNPPREREEHFEELSGVHANFLSREDQLQKEIVSLNQKCENLRAALDAAKVESTHLTQALESRRADNAVLQSKLSKVSDAEWERIKESDRLHREADAVQRKAERRVVKCPCFGEVENCARCFGAGEYLVDGYGNQV